MHHLQHVFHSLVSSTEFWAAIIGAVIGGLFAVLTQFLSSRWQRKSERDAEARIVIGVLQAIETEVELFRAKFLDAFKLTFREPNPETPRIHLPKVASQTQNLSDLCTGIDAFRRVNVSRLRSICSGLSPCFCLLISMCTGVVHCHGPKNKILMAAHLIVKR
jgi:hypothetical protein